MLTFSGRKTWITFFGVVGGVVATICLSFVSSAFLMASSPYNLQLILPTSIHVAILSFLVSTTVLVGLPWGMSARPRDYMPFLVGMGALLGAGFGFGIQVPLSRWKMGSWLMLTFIRHTGGTLGLIVASQFYLLWVIGLALLGGSVAGAFEWPSPRAPIRWLIVFGLPLVVAIAGTRVFGRPHFPQSGSLEERNAWATQYIGTPYQALTDMAKTSAVIAADVGQNPSVAPTAAGVHQIVYQPSSKSTIMELDVQGPLGQGQLRSQTIHSYQASAPLYQEIKWTVGPKIVYLTPTGTLDPQRMNIESGQTLGLQFTQQVKEAYSQHDYDRVIQLVDQSHSVQFTDMALFRDTDLSLAIAKSYEFKKRNKEAALYYSHLANAIKITHSDDPTLAKRYFEKALQLDPSNLGAKVGLKFNASMSSLEKILPVKQVAKSIHYNELFQQNRFQDLVKEYEADADIQKDPLYGGSAALLAARASQNLGDKTKAANCLARRFDLMGGRPADEQYLNMATLLDPSNAYVRQIRQKYGKQ